MKLIKQINNVFFYKNKNDILLSFTVIFFSILLIYLGIDHHLFSYNKEKFYLWLFLITTCIFFCIFFFPKEKFTNIGINNEKNVVFSCGSGVTACVLALAYSLINVKYMPTIYDGSWAEYGKN